MPISRRAKTDLVDLILLEGMPWSGALDEVAFLGRLYDLAAIGSRDSRFRDAAGDVWQHRINNPQDWEDDWVFYDSRFNVAGGSDENLLRFLCEMLHPLVRKHDPERAAALAASLNEILRPEGWELVPSRKQVGGRPVYEARPVADDRRVLADAGHDLAFVLDSDYVSRQVQRMEAAIDSDVDLAIGTAKEFVETVSKSILSERGIDYVEKDSISSLVRAVAEELRLVPAGVRDEVKAAGAVKRLLGNLAAIVQGLAEIRNAYGTGHGKAAATSPLRPRHAQLAVGAAITLGTFLYQTHEEREAQRVSAR